MYLLDFTCELQVKISALRVDVSSIMTASSFMDDVVSSSRDSSVNNTKGAVSMVELVPQQVYFEKKVASKEELVVRD